MLIFCLQKDPIKEISFCLAKQERAIHLLQNESHLKILLEEIPFKYFLFKIDYLLTILQEIKSNPQLSKALQPLTRPPTEKRFPAKQWQLPPSISGTTKSVNPSQYDRRTPQGYLNNYNTRQAVFEEAVGIYQQRQNPRPPPRHLLDSDTLNPSPVPIENDFPQQDQRNSNFPPRNNYYRQRTEYYSRLQPSTPNLPLSVDAVLSPFQAITAAVAPGAGFFLPQVSRPAPQYQPPDINLPPPPEPKGANQSVSIKR